MSYTKKPNPEPVRQLQTFRLPPILAWLLGQGINVELPKLNPFSRNYHPYGGRRPGDRAHKAWKTARRSGRA